MFACLGFLNMRFGAAAAKDLLLRTLLLARYVTAEVLGLGSYCIKGKPLGMTAKHGNSEDCCSHGPECQTDCATVCWKWLVTAPNREMLGLWPYLPYIH